jgi:hypothetical protein
MYGNLAEKSRKSTRYNFNLVCTSEQLCCVTMCVETVDQSPLQKGRSQFSMRVLRRHVIPNWFFSPTQNHD